MIKQCQMIVSQSRNTIYSGPGLVAMACAIAAVAIAINNLATQIKESKE